MREDIEALVSTLYASDCEPKDIREVINKALEMAAKECEKEHLQEPSDSADDIAYDNAVNDCAESIRKLKV
jgi:hypothetical protein